MFWKKKEKEMNASEIAYLKGIDTGFKMAWEYMVPYMQESKEKVRDKLYQEAMVKALSDLEPTIKKRLEASGN